MAQVKTTAFGCCQPVILHGMIAMYWQWIYPGTAGPAEFL